MPELRPDANAVSAKIRYRNEYPTINRFTHIYQHNLLNESILSIKNLVNNPIRFFPLFYFFQSVKNFPEIEFFILEIVIFRKRFGGFILV
jgi:hypothetical protein